MTTDHSSKRSGKVCKSVDKDMRKAWENFKAYRGAEQQSDYLDEATKRIQAPKYNNLSITRVYV